MNKAGTYTSGAHCGEDIFGRSINFRDDFQDLFYCTFDLLNV